MILNFKSLAVKIYFLFTEGIRRGISQRRRLAQKCACVNNENNKL